MTPRPLRFLCALAVVALAVGLCPARADDVDAVKEKLFQAKKAYDGETQKFRREVGDLLDKREADARKAGDKKAVDAAKAQRKAFDEAGELPPLPATTKQPITAARAKLDKAYATAVKDFVKLKEDAAAEAAEAEQQKFALETALLFGKRTHLITLKQFDVKGMDGGFANTGTFGDVKLKLNGVLAPHSILLHPPQRGSSQVSYPLGGKWTAFGATVGLPKIDEKTGDPESELTFEIRGDGKSLWKSEPVTKFETFQSCTIRVEKVKTLTLLTHCPGNNAWARCVWFEPILVE